VESRVGLRVERSEGELRPAHQADLSNIVDVLPPPHPVRNPLLSSDVRSAEIRCRCRAGVDLESATNYFGANSTAYAILSCVWARYKLRR